MQRVAGGQVQRPGRQGSGRRGRGGRQAKRPGRQTEAGGRGKGK